MRFLAFALALICTPAFAQLSVTVKPARSVVTAMTIESMQLQTADGQSIGQEVTRELPAVVRPGVPAAVVFVRHERPIGELLIKIKCRTADATQIEPGVFVVSKPGRHELEVNVIGQNPLTWDDETVVVEVAGPSPPVPPGPGPTPPPGPDDGSFDNLADRANAVAVNIGQTQRNQIAGVLLAAADKMRSFEFRQVRQTSEYIARNWPPCESPACGQLYKLASDDARNRLLSWEETQAYYRTLAAGVLR